MNIVNFLTDLANSLPNDTTPYKKWIINEKVREALETNNSENFKSFISDSIVLTNERTVTIY